MTFVTRWRAFKAGPAPLAAFWPYAADGEDAEASEAEAIRRSWPAPRA